MYMCLLLDCLPGRPAAQRVLQLFEDEDSGALADDEAVAVLVEGARGQLGGVVIPVDMFKPIRNALQTARDKMTGSEDDIDFLLD